MPAIPTGGGGGFGVNAGIRSSYLTGMKCSPSAGRHHAMPAIVEGIAAGGCGRQETAYCSFGLGGRIPSWGRNHAIPEIVTAAAGICAVQVRPYWSFGPG